MKKKSIAAVVFVSILSLALLTACGKKAQITIHDGGVDTKVEVSIPKTVDEILKEAEVPLSAEDVAEPGRDSNVEDAAEITIRRMHHVTIVTDGEKKEAKYAGGTVKDLFAQEGITLSAAQSMNVKEEDPLTEGMEIVITTSYGITVTHDGKTEQLDAGVGTVGDILGKLGISLGSDDTVTPSLDTEVAAGTKIVICRVAYEEKKEMEELPFETVRENDSSLEKGSEKTKTEGVPGEKESVYRVKMVDGKEESRELVDEVITKEPVDEVILVGTREGRYEVSRVAVPNCADGSHGYYEITYSDGSKEYVEY